jgi:DNA-binding FadR family transcriptional regulator
VIAVLELRIGVETESAALAALRRTPANVEALRGALKAFTSAVEEGRDAVGPDFQFHLEIAPRDPEPPFRGPDGDPGRDDDPAGAAGAAGAPHPERQAYLRRVNAEHESIVDAISHGDAEAARAAMRTHLANSRERRRKLAEAA